MKKEIFKGLCTALITPFKNGEVDYIAFKSLLDKQIVAGVSAVVILGTTGEPCSLTDKEREKIIKTAVSHCRGRIKVLVGCGSNCTKVAIKNYKQAEALGADGALIVTPYYNKCTQKGLIKYYSDIATAGKLPIIVYNVPSRTGINIEPKTLQEIVHIDNICGIKEASGKISQILECFILVGDKIPIYSGDDALNYIFICLGGSGSISVLSNVFPQEAKRVFDLCEQGAYNKANALQTALIPLINKLFSEVNPIPIKSALSYLGLCENELRPPLTKLSEENFDLLKEEINKFCITQTDK